MADAGKSLSNVSILVDEYFASEDRRFVDALRKLTNPKATAALADRWKRDPRPWARRQKFVYLQHPLEVPGHQPLVRRLFKQAEEDQDDALMAAFMVAFDRLIRRERKMRWRWDWQSRQSWQEETLHTPQNEVPKGLEPRRFRNRFTGAPLDYDPRIPKNGRLYSYSSRYYLRRRAWRYFRWLGYSRPGDYVSAISDALILYTDDDLSRGEDLLECWGLMNACYWRHPALKFGASRIHLTQGHSLSELTPSPRFTELWLQEEAKSILLQIAIDGQSRLVRKWAMELFKREHFDDLSQIEIDDVIELLNHDLPDIQQFGAELFEQSPHLPSLATERWLKLLKSHNPNVLTIVCDAMQQHVSPERVSREQTVQLACAKSTPVAKMGFSLLKNQPPESADDRATISRLAGAECNAIAGEVTRWALSYVGSPELYDLEQVSRFFDSLLAEVRDAAWDWSQESPVAYEDSALFTRLLETPYDDLRLRLVDDLQHRARQQQRDAFDLTPLWTSVLVGVTCGSRQKPKAISQLADAIVAESARTDQLLPVLAVAVRSIRRPELRAGLAAIARLLAARPELTPTIARQLPELELENV